jgi:hypothetical protein
MTETIGEVIETPDADQPFKVAFRRSERVIAEHFVNSRLSGEELVDALLPALRGFDPDAY